MFCGFSGMIIFVSAVAVERQILERRNIFDHVSIVGIT